MFVRWTLTDPQTADVLTFTANPSAGGSEHIRRTIDETATTAGPPNLSEGRPKVDASEITGYFREQAMFDAFVAWLGKPYPVTLVDDLGRTASIVLAEFHPKKESTRAHPWRHSYSLKYYTIVETDP